MWKPAAVMDDRGVVPQPRTGRVLAIALATTAGRDQGHAPGMVVVVVVVTEPAAIHDHPMSVAVVDAEAAAIHGHPMVIMVAGAPLKTHGMVVGVIELLLVLIAHILAVLGMRTVYILNILHSMIIDMTHLAMFRLI